MKTKITGYKLFRLIIMLMILSTIALCVYGCQNASKELPAVYLEPGDQKSALTEAPSTDDSFLAEEPPVGSSNSISDMIGKQAPSAEIMIEPSDALNVGGEQNIPPTHMQQPSEELAAMQVVSSNNTFSSSLTKKYDIPNHLTADFTAAGGWLKVFVDADILLPNTDKLPIAHAEPADFSQDIITKLFNRLCGKADMVDSKGNSSNGALVSMQESFTDGGEKVTYSTSGVALQSKDGKTVFNVNNLPNPRSAINARRANLMFWTERGLHDFSEFPVRRIVKETSVPKEAGGKLSITPSKAREKVEALIQDTGLIIADAYLVDDAKRYSGSSGKASRYAYKFLCTRSINGVPTSTVSGEAAIQTGSMQTKSWAYELMEVIVDDAGIIRVYWYSPHNISKVSNTDAKLMTFSDVQKKLQDAMAKEYGGLKSKYDLKALEIQISHISLTLQRVTDGGSIDSGTYVPAWNFYGLETQVEKNGDRYHSPRYAGCNEICLSINAVDGSIINTKTGQ